MASTTAAKEPKAPRMIDTREARHKGNKLWFTVVWLLILLVSLVWICMAFATVTRVRKVNSAYSDPATGVCYLAHADYLWGVTYATAFTPILVFVFFGIATFVAMKKLRTESGVTYSYGLLQGIVLLLAFILLQSAISMHAFKKAAQDDFESRPGNLWTRGDSSLYQATYVFGYILFIAYLFLFLALVLFKSVMRRLDLSPGNGATVAAPHDKNAAETAEHAVVHVNATPSSAVGKPANAPPPAQITPGAGAL